MRLFRNSENKKESVEYEKEEEGYIYEADIECDNCEDVETHEIEFGKTVSEYCRNLKCENCGCNLKQEK